MNACDWFGADEFQARLAAVRDRMAAIGVDVALVSAPENVFYLTGLDHWGYFAPHMLIVPADGEMLLVTRAMESVTIRNQVRNARFEGHQDSETAADLAVRLLADPAVAGGAGGRPRIGVEKLSPGMSWGFADVLCAALPNARWVDISNVVDDLRLMKSPAEQRLIRDAARVSDAAMAAAIGAIGKGVPANVVAAECQRAMTEAGGTFPGFGPFIRPSARLGEEHTTWGTDTIGDDDRVFLELSGCVGRYHAPMGRLVHVGSVPNGSRAMAEVCLEAFDAVVDALRPGALAREVYAAWQGVVDRAGLAHYRRHHCGYLVGIGIPPSWTGGNKVTGLRHDSALEIRTGMAFHILSWLMGTGRGDYFVSNTVLLTEGGAEVLTRTPRDIVVK